MLINPLISIVIISYNSATTLEKCIISCLQQTYTNVEVIFVDDGSTDNTKDIVFNLMKGDNRLTYYYQKNSGSNAARIYGYKHAHGEIISFLDSDDYINHTLIATVYNEFAKDPNLEIVIYDYHCVDNNYKPLNYTHNYVVRDFVGLDFLNYILERKIPHFIVNKCYTKRFLQKMRFDEIEKITMGDDLVANVKMGINNPYAKSLPYNYYNYRKNIKSVSSKPNPRYIDLVKMMEIIEIYLKDAGIYEHYTKLLEYNYFILFCNYVVENKYRHTFIQQRIFEMWKTQRININENQYIQEYISLKSNLWKILMYSTNSIFVMGRIFARFYGIYDEIKLRIRKGIEKTNECRNNDFSCIK